MTFLFLFHFHLHLLLHLHLHLPTNKRKGAPNTFISSVWARSASFDFGKGFGLGLVWAESQSHYFTDFYRLGLVLAPCLHRASPPEFPKHTRGNA